MLDIVEPGHLRIGACFSSDLGPTTRVFQPQPPPGRFSRLAAWRERAFAASPITSRATLTNVRSAGETCARLGATQVVLERRVERVHGRR